MNAKPAFFLLPEDIVVKAVRERRELDSEERAELQRLGQEMWARLPQDYQWLKQWEYV